MQMMASNASKEYVNEAITTRATRLINLIEEIFSYLVTNQIAIIPLCSWRIKLVFNEFLSSECNPNLYRSRHLHIKRKNVFKQLET